MRLEENPKLQSIKPLIRQLGVKHEEALTYGCSRKGPWRLSKTLAVQMVGQFGDNHKVKLGKKRSKTNGVKLSKMASGLWVSLRYFPYQSSVA